MSRHRVKVNPYVESMLGGAMLTQMAQPGQNGGRPPFLPGAFPAVPDRRLDAHRYEPVDWESPYQEEAYATREEEIDDLAP